MSVLTLEDDDSPCLFRSIGRRCERVIAQVVSLLNCESELWDCPITSEGIGEAKFWDCLVTFTLGEGGDTASAFSAQYSWWCPVDIRVGVGERVGEGGNCIEM